MIRKISIFILGLILIFGSFTQSKAFKSQPIKIGAILALTGPGAGVGATIKDGFLMGIEDINKNGGINGRRIEVVIEDNETNPTKAVAAFNKLVSINKVKIVLSSISATTMPLKPLAEEKGILLFADIAHPDITKKTKFVLRHANTVDLDSSAIITHLKNKPHQKIGIIYQKDEWGVAFAERLRKLLAQEKPEVKIISESHLPKDSDFRTQLTKVLAIKPDVTIDISFGPAAGLILKQLRELGYQGTIYASVGFALTPDAQKIAGKAAKGIYYQTYARRLNFEKDYRKRYGKEPGLYAFAAYLDAQLLGYALRKTRSTEPKTLATFIKKLGQFEGKYETVVIELDGDIPVKTIIKKWK